MNWNRRPFLFLLQRWHALLLGRVSAFFKPLMLILLVGATALVSEVALADTPRICYFQLSTNKKTSSQANKEAKDFKKKLHTLLGSDDTGSAVDEDMFADYYSSHKDHKNAEIAFQSMVDKSIGAGKTCDVLTLSGPNAGGFGAAETGMLPLKFIEELSCQDKYRDWFAGVKTLYLHGSTTVRDSYLQSIRDAEGNDEAVQQAIGAEERRNAGATTGDAASIREKVVGTLQPDSDGRKVMYTINHAYADTLDEYTSLSSRFMRPFPNTHVYGFGDAAGFAQGDEDIFSHIIAVGKAVTQNQEEAVAHDFLEGLKEITGDVCQGDKWKGEAVAENKAQYEKAKQLGCDLITAKQKIEDALDVLSDPETNSDAKILAQKAIQNAQEKITDTLRQIVAATNTDSDDITKNFSHLLMNNIYDTVKLSENLNEKPFLTDVKTILQDLKFQETLQQKIRSPVLSSLKKGDYIQLYRKLNTDSGGVLGGAHKRFVNAQVRKLHKEIVEYDGKSKNKKVLSLLMVNQLSQYRLLSEDQIKKITENTHLFPLTGDNQPDGTTWQKQLSHRIDYRQYAAKVRAGSDGSYIFNETVQQTPEYVHVIGSEILKHQDTQTAMQLAEKIRPSDYKYNTNRPDEKNEAFVGSLWQHILRAPRGTNRSKTVKDYLKEGKGNTNFQANVLFAVFDLRSSKFSRDSGFDVDNKKDFFKSLKNNPNLDEKLKPLVERMLISL